MRILIVDDEYVSRTKLKTLLAAYGDCDAVFDGKQALAFFEQAWEDCAPYDLITMDYEMPGMKGQAVVEAIREREQAMQCYKEGKEAKILMISVHDEPDLVVKSFSTGCEQYLYKPVTSAGIQTAMSKFGFAPIKT